MNVEELISVLNDFRFEYCFTKKVKADDTIVKGIYPENNDMYIFIENKITRTLETYSVNQMRQCVANAKIITSL
jgi:hypothetical protein